MKSKVWNTSCKLMRLSNTDISELLIIDSVAKFIAEVGTID